MSHRGEIQPKVQASTYLYSNIYSSSLSLNTPNQKHLGYFFLFTRNTFLKSPGFYSFYSMPHRSGRKYKRSLKNKSQKKLSKRKLKKIKAYKRYEAHAILQSVSPDSKKYACCLPRSGPKTSQKTEIKKNPKNKKKSKRSKKAH